MKDKLNVQFGKRTWWEYKWDKLAERDPAYRPQAEELAKIKKWQDTIATQEHKKSSLALKQKELEDKLGVTYDMTKRSLGKNAEWFTPPKGESIKKYKGAAEDRKSLQQIYLSRDTTIKTITEHQDMLMGHYKSRTTETGKYIHSV